MQLEKHKTLSNDIIIIDGLWGTGKSLLGPIISGMKRVEKVKIEHVYEYVSILHHLDKISPDAASLMLKIYVDMSQYKNLIGREINLRWGDDTGFAANPNGLRYVKRLFGGEGDQIIADINNNNLALNIMTHMLMLVAKPVFDAYGDRVKIVEMVRHPLYVVKHWYTYLQRFESPREFTVSIDHKGSKVPWFAAGWENEFVEANTMDKALLSIIKLYDWLDTSTKDAIAKGGSVHTISFESLTMTPNEPLQTLASFLGRQHHSRLPSILRKQKIPRNTISQGKGHASYGWSKKDSKKDEQQIYAQHLEFAKTNGSSGNMDKLQNLIESYNDKYPSVLAQYQ
jgi:hypothetical protein